MPEFHIPVQPDDLLEHNGDKYVVQLPLDVSTMAPEEIVDMLEGLVSSPVLSACSCLVF